MWHHCLFQCNRDLIPDEESQLYKMAQNIKSGMRGGRPRPRGRRFGSGNRGTMAKIKSSGGRNSAFIPPLHRVADSMGIQRLDTTNFGRLIQLFYFWIGSK